MNKQTSYLLGGMIVGGVMVCLYLYLRPLVTKIDLKLEKLNVTGEEELRTIKVTLINSNNQEVQTKEMTKTSDSTYTSSINLAGAKGIFNLRVTLNDSITKDFVMTLPNSIGMSMPGAVIYKPDSIELRWV